MSWILGDLLKILGRKDHDIGKWFSNDDNKYYIERKSDKAKCYLVSLSNGFVRAHCTSLATFLKAGNFSKCNLKKTHHLCMKNIPPKHPI